MGKNNCDFKGVKNPNYKTGLAAKTSEYKGLYNSWQNMKQRCGNPNHPKYKNYGARGIKICDEWMEIEGFFKWSMENDWAQGMQIDRIDNNGNYEPKNCQWVSVYDNSRKKSTTKITKHQAEEIRNRVANGESEYDIADEYGVVHGTIWFIINNYTHVADGECSKKLKQRSNG